MSTERLRSSKAEDQRTAIFMFSIPRKLSSSLGILGDDAKLAFRTSPKGIRRLVDVRNIPISEETYWLQFILLFDSLSEVASLITPHDIRRVISEAPENLVTLVQFLSEKLFNILLDHTFPSPPPYLSPVANFAVNWGAERRDTTKELLNCLRVLGRILPVIFETETSFEHDLLWKSKKIEPNPALSRIKEEEPQFVIEDEDDDDQQASASSVPSSKAESPQKEQYQPPLAERLFSAVIDLMFCCGFTLPNKLQVDHHKINHVIWEKGIGSTTEVTSNSYLDQNKTEVLRFLQILLSKTIYHYPNMLLQVSNPYAAHLVNQNKTPRRLVLPILCSLLNTTMNSGIRPAPTATGGLAAAVGGVVTGMGEMVKDLPYNHLVFKDEGKLTLVGTALGVLDALLDYQAADARDISVSDPTEPEGASAPRASSNAFRYFLAKLHRPGDLDYILQGITGILAQHVATMQQLLPGARKVIPYILETIMLFWKMIDLNKKFKSHLLESDKLVDVVTHLLLLSLENKDKPQHHGLCRALSYILQSLSAERAFGSKLNQPIPSRLVIPAKWGTSGTLGDFFIMTVYFMVATTSGTLSFLYPAYIIALSNVSPYLENLQVQSSTKLVQLFMSFSNPSFLLADDSHPRLVFFMLEAFNQIIFYKLNSNPNVIYGILRAHKRFEDLGTFTLAKGLRDIQRNKEAQEEAERLRSGTGVEKGKTRAVDRHSESPASHSLASLSLEDDSSNQEKVSLVRSSVESSPSHAEDDSDRPIAVPPTPTHHSSTTPFTRAISEKARGKLPARDDALPIEPDPVLDPLAAANVGRNGFVPTQEWVSSWQERLPLDTIMLLITELLPRVIELQSSLSTANTTPAILDFLRSVTLQHVLPQTPPITPRRFQWSDASLVWLSSLIWGEIYVKGTTPLGIWNSTSVKLFGVRHTPQPRGVSDIVGGFLGAGSGNNTSPPPPGGTPVGHARRMSRPV